MTIVRDDSSSHHSVNDSLLEGGLGVTARLHSNVSSAVLLHRIRAEYREMPGLQLTAPQAQRLFGVDAKTWDAALAALVDARFLSRNRNGQFGIVGM
jgi:hypothetical protein